MKKLLSVLLSLCILLTPLMSLAQGSLWLELEAGDVEARLEAGLEQGLQLRLTSEAHEPYGLSVGLSDEPMHFDGEESCGWLKPEALYQFVQLYLQMQ